jgi:hypothetical protein
METLAHVAPSRELHMQPIWLNIVRLDQVNENADVDVAQLDHLGENEALFGIIKDRLHD